MRIKVISAMIVFLFLVPQSSAAGGGWWDGIQVDRTYVAPGQTVTAETPFLFETIELAEMARKDGAFFAYLIEGLDREMVREGMGQVWNPGWWKQDWVAAHQIGRVELSGWDSNSAIARSEFTTPVLSPGRYDLMFCSTHCARPLGHIVPVRLTVSSDPVAARVASAFRNYRMKSTFRHQRLRHGLRETRASLREQGARLDELENEVSRLVDRLRRRTDEGSEESLTWGFGLLAGGLLAGASLPLWRRYRHKQDEQSKENNGPGSGVSRT